MIDALARRFDYWRWPIAWHTKGTDPVARGNRWMAFYNEEDGLKDALEALRRGYFEKAAQLAPGDLEGLRALSLADRIIAEIDGQVRQIIVEGQMAAEQRAHAARIADLPEPMRRRL